ncbi:MAG: electron transport complex subunit RsxC [Bacillota bacterium]|nr:electron transport complex subunit RsxC [Bacillota bacterium]
MKKRRFSSHLPGVSVSHHKETANIPIIPMPTPKKVIIPMIQQIGAECQPLVKKGDHVLVGQTIGDTEQKISAPIHASVSGTVTAVQEFVTTQNVVTYAIHIESDGKQELDPSVQPPQVDSLESFITAVRRSGLVGLGGAGFPSHAKLSPKVLNSLHTLVVNAAECEPYITADNRAMVEYTKHLFLAIETVMQYLELDQAFIGVERNKPEAIALLRKRETDKIKVKVLPTRYPQGGEKVMIYEITGQVIQEGKLPGDYGVLVMNVSSLAFLGQFLETGMPLVNKWLTVAGSAIAIPKNVLVPLGTIYRDIIDFCGGYSTEPGEIFMGGPMMGISVFNDNFPVLKNNNAIIALAKEDVYTPKESPCINCGKCIQACPLRLMPCLFDRAGQVGDVETLRTLKINLCMECGCCAYVCPADRQLVLANKLGKKLLREAQQKGK